MKDVAIPADAIIQVIEVRENLFTVVYLERGQTYLTEVSIAPTVLAEMTESNPKIRIRKLTAAA